MPAQLPFWSGTADDLLRRLGGSPGGLTDAEAARRAGVRSGVSGGRGPPGPRILLRQFSAWFLESVISAVLLIRTGPRLQRSHPGRRLLLAAGSALLLASLLVFGPAGRWLGFDTVPAWVIGALAGIVGIGIAAELIEQRLFGASAA